MKYYIVSRRSWFRKQYDSGYLAPTRHREHAYRFCDKLEAARALREWREEFQYGWDIEEVT